MSRSAKVQLPGEALARWRSLQPPPATAEPVERVLAWLARLQARMIVSSGRLARLMVATGLCEAEVIVECLHAQLDAGPPGKGALDYDVASDLFAIGEWTALDSLERLSARLASLDWASALDGADSLHCDLAGRLFALGREDEGEAVLARVDWHLPLIGLLESVGAGLTPAVRERLVERAARLVTSSHLPVVYHVGLFVHLAVIAGDRRWLAHARELSSMLSPEQLEATPDYAHPVEDIAWGLAELGEFDRAIASIAELAASDRWPALVRLLPHARDPQTRTAMITELIESVEPLELSWAWLIEAVPETAVRVVPRLLAIADETARFEELAAAVRYLTHEQAEPVCAWMLAHARMLEPSCERWPRVWEDTLDGLHDAGWAAMLDDAARRSLIDELFARPEIDLWQEVAPFVPDDRVVVVLEHAYRKLVAADHYMDRDTWIDLGLAVIERAPRDLAERWRVLAAEAMPLTAIEEVSMERLAAWTPEQQRAIVMARLRHHQLEFLPRQLIQPWLTWLNRVVPIGRVAMAEDPAERTRYRAVLDELLVAPGWPTHEHVVWVFALLGRCAGEAAVRQALAALGDAAQVKRMSAAEYLEWERRQIDKHELHDGEVYAMAGGSPRHNLLSTAIAAELRAATRERGCHVLSSDQRIAAQPGQRYVYADAVLVCGAVQTEPGASDVLVNPSAIVEVLSPSTEAHDRGVKWEAYQRLPSLADYLLVAQGQVRVEHYRREGDAWRYRVLADGDTIELSNGARVAVDSIYAGVFELAAG